MNLNRLHHLLQLLGKNYHLPDDWLQQRPELFASAIVSITSAEVKAMQNLITAIESVIALPAYQQHVLSLAPETAIKDPGCQGVFFGYDFHLTPGGPKLIEINTNAGGASFIALLEMALSKENLLAIDEPQKWQEDYFSIFLQEWQHARGSLPLTRIAIVDENPTQQYYYPEFVIFQSLFKTKGIDAVITDPTDLTLKNGRLCLNDLEIDLVYNRLTDFSLSEPAHAVLRQAYLEDTALVTPHPHGHALYADKRNLAILSNIDLLQSWGVSSNVIEQLQQGVPHTFIVDTKATDALWAARKKLFFKPISGYAGKGAYRGQSITRKTFNEILMNDYIAQDMVAPSEQMVTTEEGTSAFKVDIRNYAYNGKVLKIAARLYRGQVTNFRTLGGGFAAVQIDRTVIPSPLVG